MKKSNFAEALYKNAGYVAVFLVSLIYVASSLVLISKTGKSVYEIVGTGFLSLVVGSLINRAFRGIGIRRGEEDEKTVSTNILHARAVTEIVPYIDRLDEFCEMENAYAIKTLRIKILSEAGLKYGDCFDENGVAREVAFTRGEAKSKKEGRLLRKKLRKRKKAFERAVRLKIKPLVSASLTSDGVSVDNPFDFGRTKREYSRERNTTDILLRVLMAVIFGYFGVTLVSEVNLATVIWNTLQIIMYIASGIISMYSSYMWIVEDYRQGIIKKIDKLQKFKLFAEAKAIDKEEKVL